METKEMTYQQLQKYLGDRDNLYHKFKARTRYLNDIRITLKDKELSDKDKLNEIEKILFEDFKGVKQYYLSFIGGIKLIDSKLC